MDIVVDLKTNHKPIPHRLIILLILMFILGITTTYILTDYDLINRNNKNQKIEGNNAGNGSSSNNKFNIKVQEDKKMYQLGKHFNKHGRGMGYSSKSEYQQAAIEFAKSNRTNANAKIIEGMWNGKGTFTGDMQQIAISFENNTVVIGKETGQIINFFEGTEIRGLIKVLTLQ